MICFLPFADKPSKPLPVVAAAAAAPRRRNSVVILDGNSNSSSSSSNLASMFNDTTRLRLHIPRPTAREAFSKQQVKYLQL